MHRRLLYTIAVLLVLSASTVACMGDDDDDDNEDGTSGGATPTPVTAETVLADASAAWAQLNSAHFVLSVEGDAFLDTDETLKLRSAEGDVKRPDSASAVAKVEAVGIPLEVSLIGVGGAVYMTNLVTGRWEAAPSDFSYDPSVLFDESEGIGAVLQGLQNPQLDGEESVDGVDSRKVTGTVTADAVSRITAGAIQGEAIAVTIWVAKDSSQIIQVKLTEPEEIREEPATWMLQLSEHNKEVTIEVPQV